MDVPAASPQPIVLAHELPFNLGPLTVRPETCELVGEGRVQILEPRVMQVLVALHQAGGHVVSRDDLLARCWSGRIVGEDAIHRVISRLRHEAEVANGAFRIETITKVGYRMVVDGAAVVERPAADGKAPGIDRRKLLAGAGGLALVAAAGIGVERWRNPPLPAAARDKIEEGQRLWELGTIENFAAALAAFRQAAALAPDHPEPWGALALAYSYQRQTGNPSQAAEALRNARSSIARAEALEPGNADALAASAALLMADSNVPLQRVEQRIDEGLRRHPYFGHLLNLKSYLLPQVGRVQEAIAIFDRWVEQREDLAPIPGAARGYLLFNVGRTDEADQILLKMLERWPRSVSVWFTTVKVLMYSGRYDRALAMLDDVARRPVGIPEWNFDLTRKQVRALASPATAGADAIRSTLASARQGTGFAENGILFLARAGQVDAAMDVARGLFFGEGFAVGVQRFTREQGQFDNRRRRTAVLFEGISAPLRAHRGFGDLTRRLGLDDYWRQSGHLPDFRR